MHMAYALRFKCGKADETNLFGAISPSARNGRRQALAEMLPKRALSTAA